MITNFELFEGMIGLVKGQYMILQHQDSGEIHIIQVVGEPKISHEGDLDLNPHNVSYALIIPGLVWGSKNLYYDPVANIYADGDSQKYTLLWRGTDMSEAEKRYNAAKKGQVFDL